MQENPDARKAILESVERAIEAIHAQATINGGLYTSEQRSNLRYCNASIHDQVYNTGQCSILH